MPESDIRVVERLLDEHCEADNRCFESIRTDFRDVNSKLDHLLIEVTRIGTLQDVAEKAGAGAGRRAAQLWAGIIAVGVVALDKFLEFALR